MKKVKCREHGGYFQIPSKPGRPPVRCKDENPCDKARFLTKGEKTVREVATSTPRKQLTSASNKTAVRKRLSERETAVEEYAQAAADLTAEKLAGAIKRAEPKFRASEETKAEHGLNASLNKAKLAKAELEVKGWTVQGKKLGNRVEITATREDELLYAVWENGVLAQPMQYSLWSVEKPATNVPINMPTPKLPFDPEWISDSELAKLLVGNKIEVWNRTGRTTEKLVCGSDHITIEHIYDGTGDEYPENRLIKFTDGPLGVMRVIRLGQLLKVGK